ncbi:MAG: hypothetical protein UH084_08770 [Paludibacteraceae bacterium]|nr:hypothetical protein [Paludibacteraceae bacterium]
MRNYYNHSKLFLLLGALAIALLIQGVIHLYREVETYGAERHYTTAHVIYGTQSKATAMPPMVQSPSLRRTAVAVPMASSRTSYTLRHNPSASSSMKIYTTSSAEVLSIGSGGGGGGGIATTNGVGSSRRGMTYSGASVAMPTLALATPSLAATPSVQGYNSGMNGPRRAASYTGDPSDGDYAQDDTDSNIWWKYDEGEWVPVQVGDTKTENRTVYVWNGSDWVLVTDKDQADPTIPQPIGATPWFFMAVLSAAYVVVKSRKLKVKSGKLTTEN